jgi:hypothetical protein
MQKGVFVIREQDPQTKSGELSLGFLQHRHAVGSFGDFQDFGGFCVLDVFGLYEPSLEGGTILQTQPFNV